MYGILFCIFPYQEFPSQAFPKIYFVCLSVFLQRTCGIVHFLFTFYHWKLISSIAFSMHHTQHYGFLKQPLTTYICVQSELDIICSVYGPLFCNNLGHNWQHYRLFAFQFLTFIIIILWRSFKNEASKCSCASCTFYPEAELLSS